VISEPPTTTRPVSNMDESRTNFLRIEILPGYYQQRGAQGSDRRPLSA
jgi:hypothetical protein